MSNADSVRNFKERSRSKISFLGKKNNLCNYPITRCGTTHKKVKSVSSFNSERKENIIGARQGALSESETADVQESSHQRGSTSGEWHFHRWERRDDRSWESLFISIVSRKASRNTPKPEAGGIREQKNKSGSTEFSSPRAQTGWNVFSIYLVWSKYKIYAVCVVHGHSPRAESVSTHTAWIFTLHWTPQTHAVLKQRTKYSAHISFALLRFKKKTLTNLSATAPSCFWQLSDT